MEKVRLGMIGIGMMGERHLRNLIAMPDVELTGLCDVNEERVHKLGDEFGIKGIYTKLPEMLEDAEIDAVLISTPDDIHMKPVILSARAGKDIFLEKPLSTNFEDAAVMEKEVSGAKVKFMIGFIERFHQPYMRVKELLDKGAIGKILTIKAQRIGQGSNKIATRDSVITFLAIHDIDLLYWYAGMVKNVYAEADNFVFDTPEKLEDTSHIVLRFKEGVIGSIESSWALSYVPTRAHSRLEILGTEGIISVDTADKRVICYSKDKSNDIVGFDRTLAGKAELRHFVDAVKNNTIPRIGFKEGMEALKVALAAKESARSKCRIELQ